MADFEAGVLSPLKVDDFHLNHVCEVLMYRQIRTR
jgi:hypothetical protein